MSSLPTMTKEEKAIWAEEWEKITKKLRDTGCDFSKVRISCIEKGK